MLGVVASVHAYLWLRLVHDTRLPTPFRQFGLGLILLLACSIPLAFFVGRGLSASWRVWLVHPAFVWLGFMFLFFVWVGSFDLLKGFAFGVLKLTDHQAWLLDSHRLLAARMVAGTGTLLALTLGAWALWSAHHGPQICRVDVLLPKLPIGFEGTTIAQLSDLHVGEPMNATQLESIVAQTNALKPDVVVITGDLVDGSPDALQKTLQPLTKLQSRFGIYFVTGNHEYYVGVEPWLNYLKSIGIRVLHNEHVLIEKQGTSALREPGFCLAGVDDSNARGFATGHGADVAKAVAGCPSDLEIILIAHQPKEISNAVKHNVGLLLSGHTHGGQIWPFGHLVKLTQPRVAGLSKHKNTLLYVSRGAGHWGPPMRLFAPAEINVVRLHHGSKKHNVQCQAANDAL